MNNWIKTQVIYSPIKENLKYLQRINVNQTIVTNNPIFSVIPEIEGNYVCNLQVPVLNSGKVKIGQEVSISLDGFNPSEFGLLKATITDFSNVPNDDIFQASAKLNEGLITTHGKKLNI